MWAGIGLLALFGLMRYGRGQLARAADIIGEGDTPTERGLAPTVGEDWGPS
jgi:hypothetical protein